MGLLYNYTMNLKPALTIQEQLDLLRKRGLVIDNSQSAEKFLIKNNYYRLNIYFHKFMVDENCFRHGIQFSQIISIYNTDSWLRNKLLILLEPIEVNVKTRIAHHMALKYGPDCFYDKDVYESERYYCDIYKIFENELRRRQKDSVVIHHQMNYEGKFPLWVLIEFLSFNTTSKFFNILPSIDRKEISGEAFSLKDVYLTQWLHCLSVLRNICAHYGYLYRREHSLKPRLLKEYKGIIHENNTLFTLCLILKKLSDKENWKMFIIEVANKEINCDSFNLCDYGFLPEWQNILID